VNHSSAAGSPMQSDPPPPTIGNASLLPVDLSIHKSVAKESIAGGGLTPTTIAKRRRRFSEPNSLEITTLANPSPHLNRNPSDVPTVKARMQCKGSSIMLEGRLHAKTSPSVVRSSGVVKKQAHSTFTFGKEPKGMEVSQRVINACRPPRLFLNCSDAQLPVGHRTPVKIVRASEAGVSRRDDSDLSGNSDSEDCFSDHANVPTALLDAFSPVRPSNQLNSSEPHDFELEFGWDPVVRNAVIRNAFNGFGIRSH
jgi:hypothetical protein